MPENLTSQSLLMLGSSKLHSNRVSLDFSEGEAKLGLEGLEGALVAGVVRTVVTLGLLVDGVKRLLLKEGLAGLDVVVVVVGGLVGLGRLVVVVVVGSGLGLGVLFVCGAMAFDAEMR